jgi:hypothetical protein
MANSTYLESTMQLEGVHALIYLVDFIARSIALVTSDNKKSSCLFSVNQGRILCQFVVLDAYLAASFFERLIVVNSSVSNLNELMLVNFDRKLLVQVLLKLLATLNLIKNEFIVLCRLDDVVELVLVLLEAFIKVPDVSFALKDIVEIRNLDLFFHLVILGLNLVILSLHELLLVSEFLE